MNNYKNLLEAEKLAFDNQSRERIENGFIPDLRRLRKVDWFYNNVWRDPEFVKIQWMPRIQWIINEVVKSGPDVLECGCGMGMLSLELARNGLNVKAIDLSEFSIEIANKYKDENVFKEKWGSLEYLCEDLHKYNFGDQKFDTVIFFRSLHHFEDLDKIIEKISSLLKKDGKLIISEPVRDNFNQDSTHFAGILRMFLPTWINFDEKISDNWNKNDFKSYFDDILVEYKLEGDHTQSPFDNSVSDSDVLLTSLKRRFEIVELYKSDAFIDKLIGGLRGPNKYKFAKTLKLLDEYFIENKILPPTSIEVLARKEKS